jgi:hypothetical protein
MSETPTKASSTRGRKAAVSAAGAVPMPPAQIAEEVALELRRLTHDLSNSLEIIVQTSYLLGMAELQGPAADWLRMLDTGVQKALELNVKLREAIKKNSQA